MAKTIKRERIGVSDGTKFIGLTFLYMFIGLAITTGVSLGLGFLFRSLLGSPDFETVNAASKWFLGLSIGSGILLLILTFWIHLSLFRSSRSIIIPYILYTIVMGVLMSSFAIVLEGHELALGFGITTVVFGLMALVGLIGGSHMKWFGLIGIGLFMGAFIISAFSLIWYFVSPSTYNVMYTVVSIIMFLAILLITSYDVYRIKVIADSNQGSGNLALYCAFNLYVDFIYILIRILSVIASMKGRR